MIRKKFEKKNFSVRRITYFKFYTLFRIFFKKNLVFSKLYMNTAVTNANTTVHIMESFEY